MITYVREEKMQDLGMSVSIFPVPEGPMRMMSPSRTAEYCVVVMSQTDDALGWALEGEQYVENLDAALSTYERARRDILDGTYEGEEQTSIDKLTEDERRELAGTLLNELIDVGNLGDKVRAIGEREGRDLSDIADFLDAPAAHKGDDDDESYGMYL